MAKNRNSTYWWIFSIIFTLSIAYYQRTTGPTYPVRGKVTIENNEYKYKLLTSNDSDKPAKITIQGTEGITGYIEFRKYNTNEPWQKTPLYFEDGKLIGELPQQPPAGKLTYNVTLFSSDNSYVLTEDPIVIRFKGPVPAFVLLPHILFMFLAMLFSTRTGIEAIRKGSKTYIYSLITLILLLCGGMFLGPVVQKYAFGAFWTGWPFGQDLTDNKTLVAFLAWIIAVIRLRKDNTKGGWAIAAAIILLLVYLIPHSMFGSELDYSTGNIGTGQ
ncbi:MAG: hypothetical protein K8R86_05030 [Bacteroidales bacterium]|nr:hypothetical protein [Bacteroidales bacterium]